MNRPGLIRLLLNKPVLFLHKKLNRNNIPMKISFPLLFVICLLAPFSLMGQDKVNLMNGKILEGTLDSLGEYQIKFEAKGKKGKIYETYIENYRIFSVITANGKETVLYQQDSSLGNLLKAEDMRYHIAGEQDAYKNYKPVGNMVLGFGLGVGVSLFDTYSFTEDTSIQVSKGFFNASPGFSHLVFPLVYTMVSGFIRTQLDINNVTDKNNLNSEYYIEGFARTARYKRVIRALISSVSGCVVGLVTYGVAQAFK
jgi:hypothetical protein